jgi:hypothetical protein
MLIEGSQLQMTIGHQNYLQFIADYLLNKIHLMR